MWGLPNDFASPSNNHGTQMAARSGWFYSVLRQLHTHARCAGKNARPQGKLMRRSAPGRGLTRPRETRRAARRAARRGGAP